MANEDPNNPNPNPSPTPQAPPKTPDVVSDVHSKRIRDLEKKLSDSEQSHTLLKSELDELREIVRKAGESKLPAVPPEKRVSILEYLENLVFKPETQPENNRK